MKKQFLYHLRRIFLIFLVGGGLGLFALTLVFFLPSSTIMKNLETSVELLKNEGYYPLELNGYVGTRKDNYTDAVMLNIAMYYNNQKSPLDKAIHAYQKAYPSANGDRYKNMLYQIHDLYHWEEIEHQKYSRYWHGYLVFLRPLLQIFTYEEICDIGRSLQILLTLLIMYWTGRIKKPMLLPAFMTYVFTTSPLGIVSSIQFMSVHFITLFAVLFLLIRKAKGGEGIAHNLEKHAYFFFLLGMLTSYFDFLTAPIITLGIPLLVAVSLEENTSAKRLLMQLFICGVMWSVGYLGFWCTKWILGSILSGDNLFTNAFSALAFRTSESYNGVNNMRSLVIDANLNIVSGAPYLRVYLGALLIGVYYGIKNKADWKQMLIGGWPVLLFACVPFAWWLVTANHAYIHHWFTYRSISITVFAFIVWVGSIRTKPKCAE